MQNLSLIYSVFTVRISNFAHSANFGKYPGPNLSIKVNSIFSYPRNLMIPYKITFISLAIR